MISPIEPYTQEELEEDEAYRSKPQWFKFFYAAWLASTIRMNYEQRGWYITLLTYAASEGDIPGFLEEDENELKEVAGFTALHEDTTDAISRGKGPSDEMLAYYREKREKRWRKVRAKFSSSKKYPGYVFNRKLVDALKDAYNTRRINAEAGKRSADKRGGKFQQIKELAAVVGTNVDLEEFEDQTQGKLPEQSVIATPVETSVPTPVPTSIVSVSLSCITDLTHNLNEEHSTTDKGIEDLVLTQVDSRQGRKTKSINVREIQEVFVYWRNEMGKSNASSLTPERKKKIEQRLKDGYTVIQIKNAIQGCKLSPHHMGDNDRNKLFNDIHFICKSQTQLEGFMEDYERHLATGGRNGHSRQTQKPWESTAERNTRLERETDEHFRKLRERGSGNNQVDTPRLSLSLDDTD